jgi:hypothetical protein
MSQQTGTIRYDSADASQQGNGGPGSSDVSAEQMFRIKICAVQEHLNGESAGAARASNTE